MHAILAAALVFLVQSSVSAGANTVVFDYQGLPFGYEYTQGQKTKWAPCESGPYPDQCEDFNYQTGRAGLRSTKRFTRAACWRTRR